VILRAQESMGDLAASIAHEVNQPLAAIVVNAECCLLWLEKETPDLEMARKAAQRIVRNGQHASQVVRSMRSLLGDASREMAIVDLNGVIADTLELLALELDGCGVDLETRLAPAGARVRGDRTQLRQLLFNLIRNAIEAMSGTRDLPRRLRIRTTVDPWTGITATISDSGPGLDPVAVNRIFEPFFTTKTGGMGLGLAICRSIVESHGGRLSTKRTEPHGCTFEISLPAHDAS
jgi:signal transduction histidine kinase